MRTTPTNFLSLIDIENTLHSEVDRKADLCADSRLIKRGDVFLAYPVGTKGAMSDNRIHIPMALELGAALVLYDEEAWDESLFPQARAALASEKCIPVTGLSDMVGELASRWYGMPSSQSQVIGVTGTNGKTTVTHWIAQVLQKIESTAVMGTLGVGAISELEPTGYTTPDAARVQKILADLVRKSYKNVAMEVSSHALDQGRVDGVQFRTAIFTNLTQDHLDYHANMQLYAQAKYRLLRYPALKNIILNIDDEQTHFWLPELAKNSEAMMWLYGTKKNYERLSIEIQKKCKLISAENILDTAKGVSAICEYEGQSLEVQLHCVGNFNIHNAMAVISFLLSRGIEFNKACKLIELVKPVIGRMEVINAQQVDQPLVIVDFAHTPDALEKSLLALKPIATLRKGNLICVFGCGGNRDTTKRPIMGHVAEENADQIILTSDNPRNENPEEIIEEIRSGITHPDINKVISISDRAKAILTSIKRADMKDVVLISGKGHETTQEINGHKYPFSDQDHAKLALGGTA